eukprot:910405-Rhodomonas_salina.1
MSAEDTCEESWTQRTSKSVYICLVAKIDVLAVIAILLQRFQPLSSFTHCYRREPRQVDDTAFRNLRSHGAHGCSPSPPQTSPNNTCAAFTKQARAGIQPKRPQNKSWGHKGRRNSERAQKWRRLEGVPGINSCIILWSKAMTLQVFLAGSSRLQIYRWVST